MNPADFADKIEQAKARVSIFQVLEKLGVPTKKNGPNHFCCCPAHNEKTESCRVGGGTPPAFKCFGCGIAGDQIHFIEAACSLSRGEAVREFFRMAGLGTDDAPAPVMVKPSAPRRRITRRAAPTLPDLRTGSRSEMETLAALRGLSVEAVLAASRAGVLFFGELFNAVCWIITDALRVNAQARRLDGGKIFGVKAHTIANSWAKWPVGITQAKTNEILFCEGGPDLLAAFQIRVADSSEWSPVAMFGGAMQIYPAALPLFARKNVTIIPHNDGGKGDESAAVWEEQLFPVAGKVRIARIPGEVKDLNDYICCPNRVSLLPP